jgi:hypothetical protein
VEEMKKSSQGGFPRRQRIEQHVSHAARERFAQC